MRGNPHRREIALTFDDGPHPWHTSRLLRTLADYQAKATFFVVGRMAKCYPELVAEQIRAGHGVANHTYHHIRLSGVPKSRIVAELEDCGAAIAAVTGRVPNLFRPPGGRCTERVARIANSLGYTVVWWTYNAEDFDKPTPTELTRRVLRNACNGGIILLHDGYDVTVQALPLMLEHLREKGYEFVTVEDLIARK